MYLRPSGGIGVDGWILTIVAVIVLWFIAALVVLALFRHLHRVPYVRDDGFASVPGGLPTAPTEQMLAERFERGDIDEDEYLRQLRGLREVGS
jgi:putative membrane protein